MKTTISWNELKIIHATTLFFIVFPLICSNEYTVDEPYEYSIPYDSSIENFIGISTPKCGKEIKQMDVSKVKHPNQIRLSLTGDPTEMAITWTTNSVSHYEVVNYGVLETDLNYTALSISHQFKWHWLPEQSDYKYTSGYIHESLMVNLIPGRIHFYQIESNGVSSPILHFVAAPEPGSKVPISFLHTGDVGVFGTSVMVTKTIMERMEKKQNFHGMVHCGDISYANKYNKEKPDWAAQHVWDTWGQMAEPITSRMPYMVSPGNHELDVYDSTLENGTIYAKRFIMPGNERYYSFGVGMVHFVSVSTDEDIHPGSTQGVWLDRTLRKIRNQRDIWPWVVVFQHRPIYNSGSTHGNWSGSNNWVSDREMPTYEGWPDDYEALLIKHDVDLVLTGHVHHYERTWPVKNRDDVTQSYDDVTKPVHITCGHGGKNLYRFVWGTDDQNTYTEHHPRFSAARDNVHWGHCELEFLDERRVRHSMFRMGESEVPAEEVVITRVRSGVRVVGLNLGLMLACLFWVSLVRG